MLKKFMVALILVLVALSWAACSDEPKQETKPAAKTRLKVEPKSGTKPVTEPAPPTPTPAPDPEPRTILMATEANWPPMEYTDVNKQIVGFTIDYMTAAGRMAGFKPVFIVVDGGPIFEGLLAGNYDAICSSVSITAERQAVMDFSLPYYKARQAMVTTAASNVRRIEELEGETIGILAGNADLLAFEKFGGVKLALYQNMEKAMRDLVNGNIAAVICEDTVAAGFTMARTDYKNKLKIAGLFEPDETKYYGIAVKKGNDQVLDLINSGIRTVQASGRERELLSKWLGR